MSLKITRIEILPLGGVAAADGLDSSAHTLVVRITDAEGRTGIGEADAPPSAVREFLEMPIGHGWSQGLREMLVGEEAVETAHLWEKVYQGTLYPGRRGLGIHALSAVDIALHDLAGQQLGLPVYKLLGGRQRERLTPYATLYAGLPDGRTKSQMRNALSGLIDRALALGFRAVKVEVLLGDLVADRELVEILRDARRQAGDDVTMLADFGYRFSDWRAAAAVLRRLDDCDLYLAEAVLPHDDLIGHARLADQIPMRLGGAEFAATRWECREWIEKGRVDVLQPDINRCGGLTEARRIAEMASLYGVLVVPHAWKTGITVAACRHFHAATANCPLFELLSPDLWDSPLRRDLTAPEPKVEAGTMPLPEGPGLGIRLDEACVKRSTPA
jgi:L-alanine-DL-glutamate epimerase-like enolase superfamily enzyme